MERGITSKIGQVEDWRLNEKNVNIGGTTQKGGCFIINHAEKAKVS